MKQRINNNFVAFLKNYKTNIIFFIGVILFLSIISCKFENITYFTKPILKILYLLILIDTSLLIINKNEKIKSILYALDLYMLYIFFIGTVNPRRYIDFPLFFDFLYLILLYIEFFSKKKTKNKIIRLVLFLPIFLDLLNVYFIHNRIVSIYLNYIILSIKLFFPYLLYSLLAHSPLNPIYYIVIYSSFIIDFFQSPELTFKILNKNFLFFEGTDQIILFRNSLPIVIGIIMLVLHRLKINEKVKSIILLGTLSIIIIISFIVPLGANATSSSYFNTHGYYWRWNITAVLVTIAIHLIIPKFIKNSQN